VGRDQLLLLAHRPQEADGVHAEARKAHHRHHQQAQAPRHRHPRPLARARRCERQERQQQPCGELHPHAARHRHRGRAHRRARSRAQHQRYTQRQQDQRVVVRAAHRHQQQHRVGAHEHRCKAAGMAQHRRRLADQRHAREARQNGNRLERPQPAGRAQRRGGVACKREQRAVGRVLERPADEAEHRVGGRFGGQTRVGVKAVQRAHARKCQVAEHVL